MVRLLTIGVMLVGTGVAMPSLAWAQTAKNAQTAAEEANDSAAHERTFEETRKHMQTHSEWSKKTGKMNNN